MKKILCENNIFYQVMEILEPSNGPVGEHRLFLKAYLNH